VSVVRKHTVCIERDFVEGVTTPGQEVPEPYEPERVYDFYLDGQHVGSLASKDTLEFEVEPGSHTLTVEGQAVATAPTVVRFVVERQQISI
jgi:hypothetical protein